MTLLNLTHDSRTSPRETPRLRLADPPPQTLEAHLAHALRMLGSHSGPLISMLRFRSHPGPSTRRHVRHHGRQGRRP